MRQLAEDHSEGEGIDKHWEAVLPETDDIMANEIFLTLYARVVDQSMRHRAAQIAKDLPLRNVRHINDAELYLHILVRETWLGIADNPEFQAHVNSNANEAIHVAPRTAPNQQCIGWAKFSRLWLPFSEEDYVKIVRALAERFRQHLFAQLCWRELTQRHVGKKVSKYVWALLTDSEVITQENEAEAYKWLTELSYKVANGLTNIISLDAMHNWLEKLLAKPTHVQLQKIRATPKGIRQGAIDMQRKEEKHQRVALENDELVATIADELLGNPDADAFADNLRQKLVANQERIEAILSGNPKIAQRRFQVLLILTRDPQRTITDAEIARQLGVSKQTIGRDRRVRQENRQQIRNVIESL